MPPHLVAPMLAVTAQPFDSPAYSFEIKWDGVRALARVEARDWRLWGRQQADYTARYPELAALRQWPAGTLVDGELVAFDAAARPDLRRLLGRHGLADDWRIGQARRWCPVVYVVFDLLYHRGSCLMGEPLTRRREALARAVQRRGDPRRDVLCRCNRCRPSLLCSSPGRGSGRGHGQATVGPVPAGAAVAGVAEDQAGAAGPTAGSRKLPGPLRRNPVGMRRPTHFQGGSLTPPATRYKWPPPPVSATTSATTRTAHNSSTCSLAVGVDWNAYPPLASLVSTSGAGR